MPVYLVYRVKGNVFYAVVLAGFFHAVGDIGSQVCVYQTIDIGVWKLFLEPFEEIADRGEHEKEGVVRPVRELKLTYGGLAPVIIGSAENKNRVNSVFLEKSFVSKLVESVYKG